MREIAVFAGSAHPELATEICRHLGAPLLPVRVQRFSNDCLEVQLQANCREHDVFLIQPIAPPVQEHLVEMLLMLDAARGASAARVTAVMPHFAYARSDKKDQPRISIGARLVADLLSSAGASRVLTMALHSPQVHGFFSVPVDHLNALRVLADHFRARDPARTVVVSPDLGNIKATSAFANLLGLPMAAATKQRLSDDEVVISTIIGEVRGREAIVVDDEIATGGSVVELLRRLEAEGATRVSVACTHGLFTKGALRRLSAMPQIDEIVATDTVPIPQEKRTPKLTVLSIAPLLAQAIGRIHAGESVSALFHS
jgi:ribose-phosphate pyrophosphokinase